jgi:hypothetical protein
MSENVQKPVNLTLIKKGQRIVYFKGSAEDAAKGDAQKIFEKVREFKDNGAVTLYQRRCGTNLYGFTVFEYIAEGK